MQIHGKFVIVLSYIGQQGPQPMLWFIRRPLQNRALPLVLYEHISPTTNISQKKYLIGTTKRKTHCRWIWIWGSGSSRQQNATSTTLPASRACAWAYLREMRMGETRPEASCAASASAVVRGCCYASTVVHGCGRSVQGAGEAAAQGAGCRGGGGAGRRGQVGGGSVAAAALAAGDARVRTGGGGAGAGCLARSFFFTSHGRWGF